ncbi:peptidylprolyl isomerase [Pontiellaceae bacterium B12227]|nr:peptidylprolyl isomerase [Pontiellaceae bacterium B12227]
MRIFKEPLIHFILIGAVLFGLYGLVNRAGVPTAGLVVSTETIGMLAETFSNDWNRAPSDEELENLIDEYIREEVAFREGVAMGLDRDDVVIRQRIRQKLELLAEEGVAKNTPTDAELEAYLAANADVFREPQQISIQQVYFSPEHLDQAVMVRRELNAMEKPPAGFGDPSSIGQHFVRVTHDEVDQTFGLGFADKLIELPEKAWSEAIESELGFHLVYIEERLAGEVPDLGRIRNMVEFEWENEQRLQRLEKLYSDLREKYSVRIEEKAD